MQLPVYHPSEAEAKDAVLYAANVREYLVCALCYSNTDMTGNVLIDTDARYMWYLNSTWLIRACSIRASSCILFALSNRVKNVHGITKKYIETPVRSVQLRYSPDLMPSTSTLKDKQVFHAKLRLHDSASAKKQE